MPDPELNTNQEQQPSQVNEPKLSKAERRLYVSFFENLGIADEKQTVFLSTLLRNVFEASSKLDSHLAPHGASLHSAVSRMQVSDNPREAPTHRWIRVVDRLGFFSDDNLHAERIINIGMAFAYRHLEVDALAKANAMMLRTARPAPQHTEDEDPVVQLPVGGVNVATTGGDSGKGAMGAEADPAPRIDDPLLRRDDEDEGALPEGGLVFPNVPPAAGLGVPIVGNPSGGPPAAMSGPLEPTTTTGGARATGGVHAGEARETPLPDGGIEINVGHFPPGAGSVASDGGAADAADRDAIAIAAPPSTAPRTDGELHVEEDDEDVALSTSIPSHVIYDRQPTVVPTAFAVETVKRVLAGLQDRVDGMAVLRQLLDDSVLVLGRSCSRPPVKPNGKPFPSGSKGDRLALSLHTDGWWPQWRAPQDMDNSLPPVGTIGHALNRNRSSVSSRWVILVDMSDINDTIKMLSIRSARYFPKNALVPLEMVQRIWGKAPMRLPVVVACMLLLVTKEEGYGKMLADLAAAGRGTVPKNASLLSASCHEFNTSGIAAPVAPPRPPGGTAHTHPPAAVAPAGLAPANAGPEDFSQQYDEMDVALAIEDAAIKTQNRAERLRKRSVKAKAPVAAGAALAPATTPPTAAPPPATGSASALGVAPASTSSTVSAAPVLTTPRKPPARSRARAAGALAPRAIVKRPRGGKGKGAAGSRAGATPPAGAAVGSAAGGGSGRKPAGAVGGQVGGAHALVHLVRAGRVADDASGHAGGPPVPDAGAPAGVATGLAGNGGAGSVVGGPLSAAASADASPMQPTVYAPNNAPSFIGGGDGTVPVNRQAVPPSPRFPSFSPAAFSTSSLLTGCPMAESTVAPGSAPPAAHRISNFVQEQRQRRARIDTDLHAANASVSDILAARHESWRNGGGE